MSWKHQEDSMESESCSAENSRIISNVAMLVLYLWLADFRTENRERFYDLHIPLAPTINQALDDYVS